MEGRTSCLVVIVLLVAVAAALTAAPAGPHAGPLLDALRLVLGVLLPALNGS